MTAEELIAFAGTGQWITPTALERWLLVEGFAVVDGAPGLLLPTALALDLGGALAG